MVDEQQLSSTFPGPPPFYQSFTSENLAELERLKAEKGDALDRLGIPEHLRLLLPPPAPTSGSYMCFGGRYDIEEKPITLEDQGISRLFPITPSQPNDPIQSQWTLDRAFELKKLSKSLLLNFLELIGTLSVNPEQYGRKLEDMRTLFINVHHLLNEYRPHQARENLISMMEQQLQRVKAETDAVKAMKVRVEETMTRLADEAPPEDAKANGQLAP